MIRTVVQEGQKNIVVMDVFSKLIQERVIFIDGIIDEELANGIVAQMLYLYYLENLDTAFEPQFHLLILHQ